jgi:hypothetical protein
MKMIIFNNTMFWKWMDGHDPYDGAGLDAYTDMIVDLVGGEGYLTRISNLGATSEHSKIMDNLSLAMPRRYFLEVQYCAKAYATFFSSVLPTLAPHVDQLAYIEWLLYTEPGNPGYRDHLVHMFKVAFVCTQLLSVESLLSTAVDAQFKSKHFLSWCESQKISTSEWDTKALLKLALFLAAIFHDFGYGYYFHAKYRDKLFKIYQWLLPEANPSHTSTWGARIVLQSLPSAFVKEHHLWLKSNSSENEHDVIAGFYRDCIRLNHSVASAFFIIDVAESLKQSGALSQQLYVAFQLAAEACMIHDMTEDNKWVHLDKNDKDNDHFIDCGDHESIPLAMLLILADELSVWNRPRLQTEPRLRTKDKESDAVLYSFDASHVPENIELFISEARSRPWIRITADKNSKILEKNIKDLKCFRKKRAKRNKHSVLGYTLYVK